MLKLRSSHNELKFVVVKFHHKSFKYDLLSVWGKNINYLHYQHNLQVTRQTTFMSIRWWLFIMEIYFFFPLAAFLAPFLAPALFTVFFAAFLGDFFVAFAFAKIKEWTTHVLPLICYKNCHMKHVVYNGFFFLKKSRIYKI